MNASYGIGRELTARARSLANGTLAYRIAQPCVIPPMIKPPTAPLSRIGP
jgi:hypothetical protein